MFSVLESSIEENTVCCFVLLATTEEGARVALVFALENVETAVDNLICRSPGLELISFKVDVDNDGDRLEAREFDIFRQYQTRVGKYGMSCMTDIRARSYSMTIYFDMPTLKMFFYT